MKKIFIVIICLLCLCGCSKNKLFKYGEITFIDMSDSSKQKQNIIRESHSDDYLKKENEKLVFANLEGKIGQIFPNVKTKNTLEKEIYQDGDVYTLSNNSDYECIVLYIHGGAYAYEIDELHVNFCDQLVSLLNAKVYMPLYKLLYESDYKGAYALLDELYPVLLKQNKPIYIMGDSAGGGLSLAYTEYLKRNDIKLPNKLVLMSPWVDVTMDNPDIAKYEEADLTLSAYIPKKFGELWANELDTKDPLVSPLYGDLSGLPDTLLFCGTDEIMYPDNTLLFEKMKQANVKVAFIQGNGFWHVYPISNIEEQETCLNMIKEHINK